MIDKQFNESDQMGRCNLITIFDNGMFFDIEGSIQRDTDDYLL